MLENLIRHEKRPPVIVIYGEPGSGKTTIGTTFPSPIFLNLEVGGLRAHDVPEIPIRTIDDFRTALAALGSEEHGYHTLVIDTVDKLEEIATPVICTRLRVKNIAGVAYGAGYAARSELVNELVDACIALGMTTVFLAHSSIDKVSSPELQDYAFREIKLHRLAKAHLIETADMIGYLNIETSSDGKRAYSVGNRRVQIGHSAAHLSKIRVIGAPEEVPCTGLDILGLFA